MSIHQPSKIALLGIFFAALVSILLSLQKFASMEDTKSVSETNREYWKYAMANLVHLTALTSLSAPRQISTRRKRSGRIDQQNSILGSSKSFGNGLASPKRRTASSGCWMLPAGLE